MLTLFSICSVLLLLSSSHHHRWTWTSGGCGGEEEKKTELTQAPLLSSPFFSPFFPLFSVFHQTVSHSDMTVVSIDALVIVFEPPPLFSMRSRSCSPLSSPHVLLKAATCRMKEKEGGRGTVIFWEYKDGRLWVCSLQSSQAKAFFFVILVC